MRLAALSRGIAIAALGALPVAAFACKGGASTGGAAGSARIQGGQQNATAGGPGASGGGSLAEGREQAPDLNYVENRKVIAVREYEILSESGGTLKFRERLFSSGLGQLGQLGQLRLDVEEVWDAQTQAWVAPHPLVVKLYGPRTFHLVRQRDLHLGHPNGLYGNYEWLQQPGTITLAGKDCTLTVARSLRGTGNVNFYHETSTNLLLGWEMLNESGDQVLSRLMTLTLEESPDLTGVQWIPDLVQESDYDSATHDPLLGITPHSPLWPPAGYYVYQRQCIAVSQLVTTVDYLYVERWTDGVRKMFLAQHKAPLPPPNQPMGLHTAMRSQEGGVAVVETDLYDRHVFGLGGLPLADLEVVIGSMVE
jgi:hypothetical protein